MSIVSNDRPAIADARPTPASLSALRAEHARQLWRDALTPCVHDSAELWSPFDRTPADHAFESWLARRAEWRGILVQARMEAGYGC